MSVSNYAKTSKWICMKFSGMVGKWASEKVIKFWWQSGSQI